MNQIYHFVSSNFVVKIKNIMKVCILGDGLVSLTLAKALINEEIYVDIISSKKIIHDKDRSLGISKSNIEFFNQNIINIDKLIWNIIELKFLVKILKIKNIGFSK